MLAYTCTREYKCTRMAELDFGERLRRLREKTEFSQRGLSQAAGLSESIVRHYETGRLKSPSERVYKALARALKVTPEALLFGSSRSRTDKGAA